MKELVYLLPFLSVILGFVAGIVLKLKKQKVLKLLLAFSGSFLLGLVLLHLLPQIYFNEYGNKTFDPKHIHSHLGIYVLIGILFQIILEFFSKGAEHGHVHGHQSMSKLPWTLFISLCLHAFFEGIPINIDSHLAFGIAIHHFPIAVILTTFFLNSHLKIDKITFFMVSFALMTPFGTYLANSVTVLREYIPQISAIVVGILLHISSTIIFESNEGHKFNLTKITVIFLGFLLSYFM